MKIDFGNHEQTKLAATFINNIACACVIGGFVTPFLTQDVRWPPSIIIGGMIGTFLHAAAWTLLRNIPNK